MGFFDSGFFDALSAPSGLRRLTGTVDPDLIHTGLLGQGLILGVQETGTSVEGCIPLLYPGSKLPAKTLADRPEAVVIDWDAALPFDPSDNGPPVCGTRSRWALAEVR